jgi:TP901 family phage tail tape measure protein
MSIPRAQIEITASSSKLAAAFAAAKSTVVGFGKFAAKQLGSLKMGETASRAAGNMLGNLGTRGLDSVFDQADKVRDFERNLVRFGITAGSSTPDKINVMRSSIRQLSQDTAIGSAEIMAASQAYYDLTGDADGTAAATRSFARIAQASGSSMSDVATAAAALGDSLQIKPDQIEAVFSGLIAQGSAGAVTLKDFSAELTELAPKFANFSKSMGPEGAMQLGAALQVAKKGFGSASRAATGLEALMGSLTMNAAKFKGVQIFEKGTDGVKRMRNLHGIIDQISNSKLAKDPTLLAKAFGSKEALAAFQQLQQRKPMYDQMIEAGKETQTVNRDLATFLESDAGRMDKAFNKIKESIASAFTPERIKAFADAIENLAKSIGPVVDGIGKIADVVGGGATAIAEFAMGGDPMEAELNKNRMIIATGGFGEGQYGMGGNSKSRENRVFNAKDDILNIERMRSTKKRLAASGFSKEGILEAQRLSESAAPWNEATKGSGRVGEIVASKEYLKAASKTTEGRAAIAEINATLQKQNAMFAEMIAKMQSPTVTVGADTVAKAQANAPVHSTRPGGRGG